MQPQPKRTILACIDGSTYSSAVCQTAAWVAERLQGHVELLHVLDHHRERAAHFDLTGSIGIGARDHLTEELSKLDEAAGRIARLKGSAILDDARGKLIGLGFEAVTATQRHGSLVETLEEIKPRCDLVVIGKRGAHAETARGHLGSNLERVVRTAIRPVLVVERDYRQVSSFLMAYDGGPSVTKALDFVMTSPMLRGATCHILRAGHVDDKAKWYLDESAARLRAAGYEVRSHAIPGAPETVIKEVIERERIDLLVMGAYGHSRIREFVLGSTTTAMVRTSPVSVLMFK